MNTSSEHSAASSNASVEAIAAQLHAATEQLPISTAGTAGQHISEAAGILSTVAADTENASLTEAQQSTAAAAHAAGTALANLVTGGATIESYANHITGSGGGEIPQADGAAHEGRQKRDGHVSTAPETKEQYNKKIVVERRKVGDTHFVVALCEHTPENVPAILEALGSCNGYMLEAAGAKSAADIAQTQRNLAILTSDILPDDVRASVLSKVESNYLYLIADALNGTNLPIQPIDMRKDHPEYYKVTAYKNAVADSQARAKVPYPVEDVRQDIRRVISTGVVMNAARDKVLNAQLKEMANQAEASGVKDLTIGVVLGTTHYHALDGLEPDGEPNPTSIDERVYNNVGAYGRTHLQQERHGTLLDADTDRDVLATYAGVHTGDWDTAILTPYKMNSTEVAVALQRIDEIANDFSISFEERRNKIKAQLDELNAAYSDKPLQPAGKLAEAVLGTV